MTLVMLPLNEHKLSKSVFMKSVFIGPLNTKKILFSQKNTREFKHKIVKTYRHTSPWQWVSKYGSLVGHEINSGHGRFLASETHQAIPTVIQSKGDTEFDSPVHEE